MKAYDDISDDDAALIAKTINGHTQVAVRESDPVMRDGYWRDVARSCDRLAKIARCKAARAKAEMGENEKLTR